MITTTYRDLLEKLIAFRSVSTDSNTESKEQLKLTAEFLSAEFNSRGFEVEIVSGYGNPIVLASCRANSNLSTAEAIKTQRCLIYGHYDVQPAVKEDGWQSDPFALSERDGRLFARGVVDNKGQSLIHIATIFDLLAEENLAYEVTFILEGDEETGSPHLEKFVTDYKKKLACDFYLISDGVITGKNPVIEAGFRGGFNSTLRLRTAANDLHSGIYGGGVPNAALELSKLLAKLKTDQQQINLPEFYDSVQDVESKVKLQNEALPFSESDFKEQTGVKERVIEQGQDYYTAISLRPAVEITGLQSGYVGEGYRNGVPATAEAKVNFRLVLDQDPVLIARSFEEFIAENLPGYVDFELEISDPYLGVKLDLSAPVITRSKKLLEEAFGQDCLVMYSGGGLPIVTIFDRELKVPGVLAPLANEDSNMHGIDENFDLVTLAAGLKFSQLFFGNVV